MRTEDQIEPTPESPDDQERFRSADVAPKRLSQNYKCASCGNETPANYTGGLCFVCYTFFAQPYDYDDDGEQQNDIRRVIADHMAWLYRVKDRLQRDLWALTKPELLGKYTALCGEELPDHESFLTPHFRDCKRCEEIAEKVPF